MGLSGTQVRKGVQVTIYAMVDPRTHRVFYVGATSTRLCNRLAGHVTWARHFEAKGKHYDRVRAILRAGQRPVMKRLQVVEYANWVSAERYWIARMSRQFGLTNIAAGGPGRLGVRNSPSTVAKQRAAAAGRDMSSLHTPEVRAKAAAKTAIALTGRKLSAEHCAAISRGHIGIRPSEETLRRRSAALKRAWARRKATSGRDS